MKTVLITGASTGLGLAIAKLLITKDYNLILTAKESSLPRFSTEGIFENAKTHLRALDVKSDEQRCAVVNEANNKFGGVDILINNAGISYRSVVEHVSAEERQHQMEVNFEAPMELVKLVLPSMRAKRSGHIINISSVGGMMAMPTMAIYSASKFALEGASESLYYEVKPWNIKVTLIEPGFINSESFKKVRYTELSGSASTDESDAYHTHYKSMTPFIERLMRLTPATPERVANKILKIIELKNPTLRYATSFDGHVFTFMRSFLPRKFYHWVLYNNLPNIKHWGHK